MGQPLRVGLEQRPSLVDESLHRVEALARRERPHAGPLDAVAWLKVGARRRDGVVYDDSILVATDADGRTSEPLLVLPWSAG